MTDGDPNPGGNDVLVVKTIAPPTDEQEAGQHDKHLSTAHLLANLKERTVSGALVTFVGQGAQFLLNLLSIVVLARLLDPKDFGLLAMAAVVIGYLRVFRDAGLSTATVQREGITHAQVSNLFWINVGLSGAITVLLAGCSPLVAWFYRDPRLIGITLALSSTFILNGLAVQHTALLSRQMRFKALAMIQTSSVVIGVGLAITMAALGCSYWSLVVSNVVTVLVVTLFTWIAVPWRPQKPSRRTGTRPLIGFGASMASGGFIYSLARGADSMLIGRYYGAGPLGIYSRAAALLTRPIDQFMSPLESVILPGLSRMQDQPERYRRTFLRVYEATALLGCLFLGLLFTLARPLTLAVLGPKWEAAAIILAVFAAAATFNMPGTVSTWLFASQGRGREWLIASSISSVVTVAAFLIGLPFGVTGVAISASLFAVGVTLPTLFHLAGRRGPVATRDLWTGLLRYLPVSAVVTGSAYLALRFFPNATPVVQVMICGPFGFLAGVGFLCVYPPGRRTALELAALVKDWSKVRQAAKV